MEIKTYIMLVVSIVTIIGLSYGYIFKENNTELDNVDWCVPGDNITISNQGTGEDIEEDIGRESGEVNVAEDGQVFKIKGNTTYEGRDVCRAEYVTENGILVQYFTKNKDFIKFVYKSNDENVTNEIELNSTSFDTNNGDTVYDDIIYDSTTYNNMSYNDTNYENDNVNDSGNDNVNDNTNNDNITYDNIDYANIYGENVNVDEITRGD